ncbi:MAG: metallophosphoesterase [Fimbriimonadaceae bacterium]|nr:metallophosphoesterase [Fimbriimonadaceae bacterium]QYK54890.1 MAG: metallophosphoesterase [Fimbriimonadaceae bacterium]
MDQAGSRRDFLKKALVAGVAGAGAYAFLVEPGWLAFERLTVPIQDLPKPFEGYRIAVLSDIHYPMRISAEFVQAACRLAMSFDPHLVLLPGDFVHGHSRPKTMPSFRGLLDDLNPPDGVLATLGNHDIAIGEEAVRRELGRTTPARIIDNAHVLIERGGEALCIAGVGDMWYGVVDPDRALAGVDPGIPRILMSHNPDFAHDMPPGHRVDLQISGHTHGGEVWFPFFGDRVIPSKYGDTFRQGLVQGRRNLVYVTRGIGSPRGARFLERPEVTAITLTQAG